MVHQPVFTYVFSHRVKVNANQIEGFDNFAYWTSVRLLARGRPISEFVKPFNLIRIPFNTIRKNICTIKVSSNKIIDMIIELYLI